MSAPDPADAHARLLAAAEELRAAHADLLATLRRCARRTATGGEFDDATERQQAALRRLFALLPPTAERQ